MATNGPAKDGNFPKRIRVSEKLHKALTKLGKKGETFEDILWRLVHVYQRSVTEFCDSKKEGWDSADWLAWIGKERSEGRDPLKTFDSIFKEVD